MYELDFHKPCHVHFIGIGGISMSGLAEILLKEHFTVTGSDTAESPLTEHLKSLGAGISCPQSASNITDDIDTVVYTAAIHDDNPELMSARAARLPLLSRAELLGQLMRNYPVSIAVSGTHGKTTTTSMLTHILLAADADPTVSVGGMLKSIGGNVRIGGSGIFLTEACEYTNSFLQLRPKIGVILNIEADHLDFFKTPENVRKSFHDFAALIPADGVLVINKDIENLPGFLSGLPCRVVTFSLTGGADFTAADIRADENGNVSFDLVKNHVKNIPGGNPNVSRDRAGGRRVRIRLSVPGAHNAANALAAAAAADAVGISIPDIQKGLTSFTGTARRFEYKGTRNGFTVIDDYAHHPTEIRAALTCARGYPHREIWCVFQPHTYSRTKSFFDDFVDALSLADHVIMADIYAARETDTLGISSEDVARALAKAGTDAYYFPSFGEIEDFVLKNLKTGDMLITMGAGNVVDIGDSLLS